MHWLSDHVQSQELELLTFDVDYNRAHGVTDQFFPNVFLIPPEITRKLDAIVQRKLMLTKGPDIYSWKFIFRQLKGERNKFLKNCQVTSYIIIFGQGTFFSFIKLVFRKKASVLFILLQCYFYLRRSRII